MYRLFFIENREFRRFRRYSEQFATGRFRPNRNIFRPSTYSDWILISRMIRQKTIVTPASPSLAFHVNPITEEDGGIAIRIRASPNAKKTEVVGVTGDRVKIRLHAPPVDGKANKELISFLAKTIGVRKSACTITHGETSRDKTAFVRDVSLQQVKSALGLSVLS